jgi:phasin
MSEHDKSRKIANETLEKGKVAVEQTARSIEQSYSTSVENMREYNLKMIDMAHANAEVVFELARQLATAKTPSDFMELWTSHTRKQFEMLSEQASDLTALGQKMAGQSAEPLARNVNQAFKKAS